MHLVHVCAPEGSSNTDPILNNMHRAIWYMDFNCSQCGQCCMYLGDYIEIEEQTGPYTFSCSCVSTNTPFSAVVDEDKRNIFDNTEFLSDKPHACRFLRPVDDGRIVCTIHETSPAQCKIYRCVLMRIFSSDNQQIGYITGTGALHSDNPVLREVYESAMNLVPDTILDKEEWIAGYIRNNGYLIH